MTVLDLVKASMRLIGCLAEGQTPRDQQVSDAVESLNLLCGELQADGLIARAEFQTFSVAVGDAEYSIGSGADWNGHAPLRIIAATIRNGSYDDPVKIIGESHYAEICDKTTTGEPTHLCYLPEGLTGTARLYPVPDQNYQITILSAAPFDTFSVTGEVNYPPAMCQLLKYGLAIEIAPEYETTPSEWIMKRYSEILAAQRRVNLKRPKPMRGDQTLGGRSSMSGSLFRSGGL